MVAALVSLLLAMGSFGGGGGCLCLSCGGGWVVVHATHVVVVVAFAPWKVVVTLAPGVAVAVGVRAIFSSIVVFLSLQFWGPHARRHARCFGGHSSLLQPSLARHLWKSRNLGDPAQPKERRWTTKVRSRVIMDLVRLPCGSE